MGRFSDYKINTNRQRKEKSESRETSSEGRGSFSERYEQHKRDKREADDYERKINKIDIDTLSKDYSRAMDNARTAYSSWTSKDAISYARSGLDNVTDRLSTLNSMQDYSKVRGYNKDLANLQHTIASAKLASQGLEELGQVYSQFDTREDFDRFKKISGYEDKYKGKSYKEITQALRSPEVTDKDEIEYLKNYGLDVGYSTTHDYDEEIAAREQSLKDRLANPLTMGTFDAEAEQNDIDQLKANKNMKLKGSGYGYNYLTMATDFAEKSKNRYTKDELKDIFAPDGLIRNIRAAKGHEYEYEYADYMEENEKAILSYLIERDKEDGSNRASEYMDAIKPSLVERDRQATYNNLRQSMLDYYNPNVKGGVHPADLSMATVITNALTATQAMIEGAGNKLTGSNENTWGSMFDWGQQARKATGDLIEEGSGKTLRFLYDTAMSMVDSGVGIAMGKYGGKLGENIHLAIMGASAGKQQMEELEAQGASDGQIIIGGALTGLAEGLFEKISLDRLLKEKSVAKISEIFLNALKQGGTEASEEVNTEIANFITDYWVRGGASEFNQNIRKFKKEGMSDSEARDQAVFEFAKNVGLAGLGGGLSGFLMGGAEGFARSKSYENVGDRLSDDQKNQLKDLAKSMPEGSESLEKFNSLREGLSKRAANVEMGELYEAVNKDLARMTGKALTDTDLEHKSVLEYAEDMSNETQKNLFLDNYDGKMNSDLYYREFNLLYEMGKQGYDTQSVAKVVDNLPAKSVSAIYEAGLKEGNAQVRERQQAIMDITKKYAVEGESGKFTMDDKVKSLMETKTLTERQINAVKFLEEFSKITGANINMIASEKSQNGEYGAEQGSYDKSTNTITVDVYSGVKALTDGTLSKDTIINTASHEITHWAQEKSPALYNELKNVVLDTVSKEAGVSQVEYVASRIKQLKNDYAAAGISKPSDVTWEQLAIDETIADACSGMLSDKKVMGQFLSRLSQTQKVTFANKVKNIIDKIRGWIKECLTKYTDSTSYEAKLLRRADEAYAKAGKIWANMIAEASKANQAMEKAIANGDLVGAYFESGEDDSSIMHSLRQADDIETKSNKYYEKHKTEIGKDMLDEANRIVGEMAKYMMPYLDTKDGKRYLPEEIIGKTIFDNGSYGKTIENTTICFRTLAYIDFTNDIKEKIGRPLTVQESFLASQMLYDIAKEPQCLYCYVSLDRKAYDGFLLDYIKQRDAVLEKFANLKDRSKENIEQLYKDFLVYKGTKRKSTKPMRARFNMWINTAIHGGDFITVADLTTEEKRSSLKEGALAEQIDDAERYAQSASWAKKMEQYRAYNGEILKMSEDTIKKLNKEYGLRFYSFSEYTPAFIVENMQQIRDASLRGLYGLAYTKKADFARIFADTGMNINMSVFGKMVDGEVVPDTKQGADWDEVKELRNQHKNVGAVFVATSDELVDWALAQDWIDVVIPFHIVRTGADVAEFYNWVNHTAEQADKNAKGKNKTITPSEHHNDRATFERLIKERNLKPRFDKWLDNPNYMKLVNETRLSDLESSKLMPNFTEETLKMAKQSFDNFVSDGGYYGDYYNEGIDYEAAVNQVVDDINAGKRANEVDYGRQDVSPDELMKARKKIKKTHGQNVRRSVRPNDENNFEKYDASNLSHEEIVNIVKGIKEEVMSENDKVIDPYRDSLGVRAIEPEYLEAMSNSHRWEDGERTDEELNGVSAIQTIDLGRLEFTDIESAVELVEKALKKAKGYVWGNRKLFFLLSENTEGGEDIDEIVMSRNVRPLDISSLKKGQDIRHSIRRSHEESAFDLAGDYKRLQRENKKLTQDLENLKALREIDKSLTHGMVLKESAVRDAAKRLIDKAEVEYDVDKLVEGMRDVYAVLLNKDGVDYDVFYDKLNDLANDMAKHSIRNSKIFKGIDESDIEDKQVLHDVKEYYDAETERYLASEIYNQFWQIPVVKTTADKHAKEIGDIRRHHHEMMQEMRESHKATIAEYKEKGKAYRDRIHQLIEQRDERVKEQKAKARERIKEYKDEQEKRAEIKKITDRAKTLNSWLVKNSAKEHVPYVLREPIARFLAALDFSSRRLLGYGNAEILKSSDYSTEELLEGGKLAEAIDEEKLNKGTPTSKDISLAKTFSNLKDEIISYSEKRAKDEEVGESVWFDLPEGFKQQFIDLSQQINAIAESVGDNAQVLNEMSSEDLKNLRKAITSLKNSVSQANRLLANAAYASASASAQDSMEDLDKLGERKGHNAAFETASKFLNFQNATPITAFDRFGRGGQALFKEMQDGWDRFAFNIAEIKKYAEDTFTGKQAKNWRNDIKEFTFGDNHFKISTPQLMSLYCLSKRAQSDRHIAQGGIRIDKFKYKDKKLEQTSNFKGLTKSDLDTMFSKLTEEQKKVADKLQVFMNTVCSTWGNEVSMKRYGIKQFEEENYFPIESNENMTNGKDNPSDVKNSLFRLLNMSFTKALTPNASNPIMVRDIFDVFAQHSSDMAKYNALALPALDMYKWYSYREIVPETDDQGRVVRDDEGRMQVKEMLSTKQALDKAYGKAAKEYITTFLEDINGEYSGGREEGGFNKLASLYKLSAVAYNLRVALLQPTSFVRAAAVLDPSDMAYGLAHWGDKDTIERFSGTAVWKDLGFFDTNVQRNVQSLITQDETWIDKAADAGMWLAEKGDKLTWRKLWSACEHAITREMPDLKRGSDEFNRAVADKFRDVIYRTQVMDSTMTRSQMMRSKAGLVKLITAFMSEPTISLNLLTSKFQQFNDIRRETNMSNALHQMGRPFAKACIAYLLTSVANALAEALVDAWRYPESEDEDANFLQKYHESYWDKFVDNLVDDVSVLQKLPWVKDVVQKAKVHDLASWIINEKRHGKELTGEDISKKFKSLLDSTMYSKSSRMDQAWLDNATNVVRDLLSVFNGGTKQLYSFTYDIARTISTVRGIPIAPIWREFQPLWDNTIGEAYPSMKLKNIKINDKKKEEK